MSQIFSDIRTFVISLEPTPRNRVLTSQLSKQGIPFRVVSAVDGRSWCAPFDPKHVDTTCFTAVLGRMPTGPEIGCALSHLSCIREAKSSEADYALVFEDDSDIVSDLAPIVEIIKLIDDGTPKIFQLHSYFDATIKKGTILEFGEFGRQKVGRFFKPPRSTAAYCINKAAIEIYSEHRTVKGVADWPPFAYSIEFWGFFPSPVMLAKVDSTIEPLSPISKMVLRKNYVVIFKDFLRLFRLRTAKEYGRCLGGVVPYFKYVILPNTLYLIRSARTKYHGTAPHTYRSR